MILGQTVLEIFDELISCQTNEHDEAYPNSAKRITKIHKPLGQDELGLVSDADHLTRNCLLQNDLSQLHRFMYGRQV